MKRKWMVMGITAMAVILFMGAGYAGGKIVGESISLGEKPADVGLIRVPSSGGIVARVGVDVAHPGRANIISWDVPQGGNRIRIGPVRDVNGASGDWQFGEVEFYTDTKYTFNPDPLMQQKALRYLENGGNTAFGIAHNGNTAAYVRIGGGLNWMNEPNFVLDPRVYVGIFDRDDGGTRQLQGGGQDTHIMKIGMGLSAENGVTASALTIATHVRGMSSQTHFGKAVGLRMEPIGRQGGPAATADYVAGFYSPSMATFGDIGNYAIWLAGNSALRVDGSLYLGGGPVTLQQQLADMVARIAALEGTK